MVVALAIEPAVVGVWTMKGAFIALEGRFFLLVAIFATNLKEL